MHRNVLEIALQGDALGLQDAGHAADATGRRAFSCPGMGRVLSQRVASPLGPTGVSPLPLRLLVLEWKFIF